MEFKNDKTDINKIKFILKLVGTNIYRIFTYIKNKQQKISNIRSLSEKRQNTSSRDVIFKDYNDDVF